MKEWTLTLPRELPLWEFKSRWTLKFSKSNCKGQKPLDYVVPYIIGKLLECGCLKWASMTHLDISNTSYGQKKGRKSNWQFDSWPLKVKNHPNFLMCRWHATYHWKALDKCYNFPSDLISIGGLHAKLWAPKIARQNDIWVLVLWPGTKYIIRGKVVASPKSGPWWVLRIQVCMWFVYAPKMLELYTN